jgi:CelD/BcsL family acetyltransferase involved in cellulose biosynthesis
MLVSIVLDRFFRLCELCTQALYTVRQPSAGSLYTLESAIELSLDTGNLLLLRALDPRGKCIATGIYPAANTTMYFWGGASWREHHHLRPNQMLHWAAMMYWKARGMKSYDMGGGGAYKKQYGGREIAVPWVMASKYPALHLLRNCARAAWRIRQRTSGLARAIGDKLHL